MKKKIQSFINLFGGKNQVVASNGKNSMFKCSLSDALLKNKQNHDVYFVVNPSTGLKERDVTHLSCNYVDLDAGKDSNGNYLSNKKVQKFKVDALKKINQFIVKPTTIVETRNGFHVYWNYKVVVIANYANRVQWKNIQTKIVNHFESIGSDKAVQKTNQLLRVPYTFWHKTWSGTKESFLVKIVKSTRKQSCYKFEDLIFKFSTMMPTQIVSNKSIKNGSYTKPSEWNTTKTHHSYTKKSDWSKSKQPTINNGQFDEKEVVDFLNDLSQVLYVKNMRYFSTQCREIVNKILYK